MPLPRRPSVKTLSEDLLSRSALVFLFLSPLPFRTLPLSYFPFPTSLRGLSCVSRGGGCNSRLSLLLYFPSLFLFALSFPFASIACLGHRPSLQPLLLLLPSSRATRSTVRVCSRRRSALAPRTLARASLSFSRLLSFHRSCVLSSKHTPHARSIRSFVQRDYRRVSHSGFESKSLSTGCPGTSTLTSTCPPTLARSARPCWDPPARLRTLQRRSCPLRLR